MFQSLFYWILFSYQNVISSVEEALKKFQSLFYWILFSYKIQAAVYKIADQCFNPYSIGFYSLISSAPTKTLFISAFQSLFYWILFSYPFYIEGSLFLTLIEFFWESNSIKINRYVTRFYCFFTCFRNFFISQFLYFSYFASKKNYN